MDSVTISANTPFGRMNFTFSILCDEELVSFRYGYGEKVGTYRSRSRKIYTNKKGKYFIHQRQKIYFV